MGLPAWKPKIDPKPVHEDARTSRVRDSSLKTYKELHLEHPSTVTRDREGKGREGKASGLKGVIEQRRYFIDFRSEPIDYLIPTVIGLLTKVSSKRSRCPYPIIPFQVLACYPAPRGGTYSFVSLPSAQPAPAVPCRAVPCHASHIHAPALCGVGLT